MRAMRAALCLALVALGTVAANDFQQCGGSTNCNGRANCRDAAWGDVECVHGFVCGRQNEFYWQCTNDPSAVAAAKAAGPAARPAAPAAPASAQNTPKQQRPAADAGAPRGVSLVLENGEVVVAPTTAVAAAAPPGPAKPAAAAPAKYPGLKSAGPRRDGAPEVQTCACVDVGLNDGACFKGITRYCESERPNMRVCEAFSGFFNMQNATAGKVVADFLVDTCALVVPYNPSPCACLDDPNSDGCKAAALHFCSAADLMCASLAFGPEANSDSQEAYAGYMDRACGGSMAAAQVSMNFTDITIPQFNDKYARGVIAALAAITKLRAAAITALPPTEIKTGSLKQSLATGGARRLAQANLHPINKVLTTYIIRSSPKDAPDVLERLQEAGANGGEGLYAVLEANGVPLRPSFSIGNGPTVNGVKTRVPFYITANDNSLDPGAIAGIVVGCVAFGALVAALAALFVLKRRQVKQMKKARDEPDAEKGGNASGDGGVAAATTATPAGAVGEGAVYRAAEPRGKAAREAERAAAKEQARLAEDAAARQLAAAKAAAAEAKAAAKKAAAEASAAVEAKVAAAQARAVAEAAEAAPLEPIGATVPVPDSEARRARRKQMFSLTASGLQTNAGGSS